MQPENKLGVTDYCVLCLGLLISLAIGMKFHRKVKKTATVQEYMMAGRNMVKLPVILSICVTMLSATSMLGLSMEVYRFGLEPMFAVVPLGLSMILASYIFVPVYFECGVSSIYEFLELRYGLLTRQVVSGLFVVQMIIFMSVVLYAPALALSAVSDLSLETSIIVVGICCSVYCAVGGLKGVLWTDVFQAALIFVSLIIIYIKGTEEAGGLAEIFRISEKGGRLVIFDPTFDMTTRYNMWNLFAKLTISGLSYGASQLEVQRMLAFSTCQRARSALCWSVVPTVILTLMCGCIGLVLYTIFHDCDPLLNREYTGIKKYDQVLPYYIVSRLSVIPGITGLCIAGIFSGSLSSISSALNSLATVTVLDFIKPLLKQHSLTERNSVYLAKALTILYGGICIGFTFAIVKADGIQAVGGALISILEGPVMAIFLLGVLTRKGSQKVILVSLCLGAMLNSWMAYGYIFGGRHDPSMPVSASGCENQQQDFFLNTTSMCGDLNQCTTKPAPTPTPLGDIFFLFRISYMWLSFIGLCSTTTFALVGILLTGWKHNEIPADSKCLSPVTRLWTRAAPAKNEESEKEELKLEEIVALNTPDHLTKETNNWQF